MLRSRSLTSIIVCRIRKVMLSTVFSPLIRRRSFVSHGRTLWSGNLSHSIAGRQECVTPLDPLDGGGSDICFGSSGYIAIAIVECLEGAAYHFRFFQYFISRQATMKLIRTTGQCLVANFQNGLSSIDSRRKNSVTRLITSPETKISLGSVTVS